MSSGRRFRQVLIAEEDFSNCRKANHKSERPLTDGSVALSSTGHWSQVATGREVFSGRKDLLLQ